MVLLLENNPVLYTPLILFEDIARDITELIFPIINEKARIIEKMPKELLFIVNN